MSIAGILRRVPLLCLLVAAGGTVILAVVTSVDPDNYFYYRHDTVRDWSYPTTAVVIVCTAVLGEAAVAAMALRAGASSRFWKRGLIVLLVLGPWAAVTSIFTVHMPLFVLLHHTWLWLLLLAIGVGVAVSGCASLLSWLRLRSTTATIRP